MKQIDIRLRQITNASKLETDQLKSDQMSKRGQIVKIPEFITPVCQIDLVFQWWSKLLFSPQTGIFLQHHSCYEKIAITQFTLTIRRYI